MERLLTISLDGAKLGRRIGWLRAQSKAVQVVLEQVEDIAEARRIAKMIRELEDK